MPSRKLLLLELIVISVVVTMAEDTQDTLLQDAICKGIANQPVCEGTLGCVWCVGTFGPVEKDGSCYNKDQAAWLPAIIKCSKPSSDTTATTNTAAGLTSSTVLKWAEPSAAAAPSGSAAGPVAPGPVANWHEPSCSDTADKDSCDDLEDCVWCEKGIMGRCFDQEKAKWLPPWIFTCSKPLPNPYIHQNIGQNIGQTPPDSAQAAEEAPCKDAVDESRCSILSGCVWCEASFSSAAVKGRCYSESKAHWLPAIFKCNVPKVVE